MASLRSAPLKSMMFGLLGAFFALKSVQTWVLDEITRHLVLGIVLLGLPRLFAFEKCNTEGRERSHSSWTLSDTICLVYLLLPFLLHAVWRPRQWDATLMALVGWLSSLPGALSVFLAPLVEEYFFRGWLLQGQLAIGSAQSERLESSRIRAIKVCYFNALVFWVFHAPLAWTVWTSSVAEGQIPMAMGPFLLGLVTCGLRLQSGRLRSPIVFHMLANALGPVWQPLMFFDAIKSFFYY